jgi:Ni/Co efflux regulator RcnB
MRKVALFLGMVVVSVSSQPIVLAQKNNEAQKTFDRNQRTAKEVRERKENERDHDHSHDNRVKLSDHTSIGVDRAGGGRDRGSHPDVGAQVNIKSGSDGNQGNKGRN